MDLLLARSTVAWEVEREPRGVRSSVQFVKCIVAARTPVSTSCIAYLRVTCRSWPLAAAAVAADWDRFVRWSTACSDQCRPG